jgi:hypothetical protein
MVPRTRCETVAPAFPTNFNTIECAEGALPACVLVCDRRTRLARRLVCERQLIVYKQSCSATAAKKRKP